MAIFYWIAVLTIVRVTNSETVDVKEKLRVDLSNVKDQLNGMQGNTADLKKSLDDFSNGLDEYIGKGDAAADRKAKLEKAKAVVDGTLAALPKFKSGDPGQIISGVLDMTSMALTTFGGPYGAAAAVVVNIVSGLIGLFMTTPKSTPSIDKVMAEALENFHDKQLYQSMKSFARTLGNIRRGILKSRNKSKAIKGKDLSENEITQFKTDIEIFHINNLLGNVKQSIADEIKSDKVSDAQQALQTLNVYCKLTTVVDLTLVELMNYIMEESSAESVMPAYFNGIMKDKRDNDKVYLEFLHLPDLKEALVAAIYQNGPEKYPELRDYITAINVAPIPDSGLKEEDIIYLTPKKLPKMYFYLTSKSSSYIYGSQSTDDQSKFILKKALTGEEGREWRVENKYYPGYFITAIKYENCLPLRNPAEVKYVKGLTMDEIEGYEHDCHETCRGRERCCGCYSNCYSSEQYPQKVSFNFVWRFTKLKSTGKCSYYFISATQEQFGPEYTLFMKNGYAYLKYGNPKEKGMFKLTKDSCKH